MVLTSLDKDRLERAIHTAIVNNPEDKQSVDALQSILDESGVVTSDRIDSHIVTMNSRVSLEDLATGEVMIATVVYPDESSSTTGRISVLAPIGMSLLGKRPGDVIESKSPVGVRRLKVQELLFQPEDSGNYSM